MRLAIIILLGLMMTTPALAEPYMCQVNDPHNCAAGSETADFARHPDEQSSLVQMTTARKQNSAANGKIGRQLAQLSGNLQHGSAVPIYHR